MLELLRQGKSKMRNRKYAKAVEAFQWRQSHLDASLYPIELEDGNILHFKQVAHGETTGIGTGATLWPAAHVLSKYLEKKLSACANRSRLRIVDIGSGTGCTGLVAAACGCEVTLTDQECVFFLLQENKDSVCQQIASLLPQKIHLELYDWGSSIDHLNPPFDIVLVSDCVLPKLYPIEPLVQVYQFPKFTFHENPHHIDMTGRCSCNGPNNDGLVFL